MGRHFSHRRIALFCTFFAVMPFAGVAEPAPTGSPESAAAKLTPLEAGARYGQALGVLEICIGSKTTDKVAALQAAYTGDDATTFKAQATKVYEAWVKVKNCSNKTDPNQCKIIMDRSCEAAFNEIGPNGTAAPGLVTPFKP